MYYSGMSINEIRTHFKQENGSYPSSKSVYGWIQKYTEMAVNSTKDYQPKVSDKWVCDETYIRVDKSKANVENPYSKSRKAKWVIFWDVIDSESRFLLATHLTTTRNKADAQAVMEKAAKKAGKIPKVVVTDKLGSYLDGIELAFGSETKHKQSSPFEIENDNNLIERFHGTLKERTKVMRALKNKQTLQQFSDGWLVHYNYFKPHMSLEGKSPAEVAGINYQYRNWAEMIRQPVAKQTSVQSLLTYRNKIDNAYRTPKIKTSNKAPRITKRTPKITKGVFTNKQGSILSNHSFRGSRRIG
jgi:putative transposase